MSHRKRRPSLLGGLIWTAAGVLFLLRNFGIGPDFWYMASRYWPILLILLGLGKVIDYYRHKEGVSLRVGEVIGILLLLLVGSFLARISKSRFSEIITDMPIINFGGSEWKIGEWVGRSYTFEQEASYPIASAQGLRVENSYGNVTLAPGSDREIRVRLRKVVYQEDESRAKQIADEIQLSGGGDAGVFVVKTNRDALASKDYRFRTEMEVLVPKKSHLQVRNAFGEVRVSNLEGKLDLGTTYKQLEVRDCNAEVSASNRYGECRLVGLTGRVQVDARGRVYLENIKGDVTIRDEYSPVEAVEVDGRLTVSNIESSVKVDKVTKPVVIDARGSQITANRLDNTLKVRTSHRAVQISEVKSDVSLDTSYCNVALKDVQGNVEIASNSDRINADDIGGSFRIRGQGSGVRANGVAGLVDIETSFKDVIVNDFESGCKITNEHANVTLSSGNQLKGDLIVKNRTGDIELYLPEDAGFQIEAMSRNGRVDTNFPGLMQAEALGDSGVLKGKVKTGGPKIQLETEYNKIRVRTRGSEPARFPRKRGREYSRSSAN